MTESQASAASVWVVSRSSSGGPEYDVIGVFATRDSALASTGGVVHPGAGRQERVGGVGWQLPDGTPAYKDDGDTLMTSDTRIERWEVAP